MRILLIRKDQPAAPQEGPSSLPDDGFLWIDASASAAPAEWRDLALRLTGTAIFDAHIRDAGNEAHPSFFDDTSSYELIVFRGLSAHTEARDSGAASTGPINTQPYRIKTVPQSFFLFDKLLITVGPDAAPAIEAVRARLLASTGRAPGSPEDLVHRILNSMVDRYLELRQPLAERLDRWQRNLLDPKRPFNDWHALLEQRIEIRKLEHLCEEQRDAIQEWRDSRLEDLSDAMTVRVTDLLEHIARVLNHAQRLEQTAESAVQLHFSATAHRTNEIMRTLTIITAIFMPLTLITGIFGMNFRALPGLDWQWGFWATVAAMLLVAAVLMAYFRFKRIIDSRDRPRR
ncbi:MAG: magnesium transporter CorA family protein [Burkholderiales bacterium]|nr:magnesium transporter CorA family protein [Burkholderiales bacterium]